MPRSPRGLVAATILLLGAGCTHVYAVNVQPTALDRLPKSPAHVGLVLDEGLTGFDLRYEAMGDTFMFPLGPGLEGYARNVAQSHFREVTVFATAQQAAGKGDGILVPRAVKVDESHGIFTTTERRVLLEVEWTLKDSQDQGPLWVDTITAKAGRSMGNAFTYKKNERILFQELFDDLSRKTVKAFQESREIQELVDPSSP